LRPRERAALIASLIVVATVAYGHVLQPNRVMYSRNSDVVAYYQGTKEVLYRAIRSGEGVPFWRSDQLSGTPALSNPNSMYTYPFHFPFLLLPPAQAVGWVVWIHSILSAIGYFLLGERLGLGKWPSLLMGMAGLFNFKNIVALYAGWIFPSLTLLPWIFLGVFAVLDKPGPRSGLLAALTAAVVLHAGHLQLVYYSLLFVLGLIAAYAVRAFGAREFRNLGRVGGWLLTSAALASGLSAYLLVPTLAEAPLISRLQASYEFLQAGHQLSPMHLLTLVHPEALGSPLDGTYYRTELWEDVAYFGIVPLALAVIGATRRFGQWPTTYFVCGLVISIICALDTPIGEALYAGLPGFSLFRIPARLLYLTAFFGIVLAGVGAAELLALGPPTQRRHGVAVVAMAIAIIAGEGWMRVHRYVVTEPVASVQPAPDLVALLAGDRAVFRTLPIRPTLNYGSAAAANLQIISGYDGYNLTHYGEFVEFLEDGRPGAQQSWVRMDIDSVARRDALDILNVKYVLSPEPLDGSLPGLTLVARLRAQPVFVFYAGLELQDVYVYLNASHRARAFWVDRVLTSPAPAVRTAMAAVDLRRTAVIEGDPDGAGISVAGSPDDVVQVESAAGGRLIVNTQSQTRRFLVISEVYHPGWQATIDGEDQPLERTNHALLGVWVPPGRHQIALDFRPPYWLESVTVSAASAAGFIGLAAMTLWRDRRAKRA
jgi:hypothetical protein